MADKRITYSKNFKRKALLGIMNGEKFEDILSKEGFDIDSFLKNDKKYCSKLLHKWKKEIYQNKEFMYFLNSDLSDDTIKKELLYLCDNKEDTIMKDVKKNVSDISQRYEKLKTRILSANTVNHKNKR